MASPAHCFFCFEALDASFEHSSPPKLERVLDLYERYIQPETQPDVAGGEAEDDELRGRCPDDDDDDDDDDDGNKVNAATTSTATAATVSSASASAPQNPSISRLQKSSTSSASSRSSSASSPSTMSGQSTRSQLSTATSMTSISTAADVFPLFVTWNTLSARGNKSLRGCIGTFEALPLEHGLQTYAITAAFDDTRFSPIPASLVPSLSCSLTLLADFEPCAEPLDWVLGTHGIRISFTWRNRRHGATYLPDVAVEQGWTKEETLESLMKKAGWDGSSGGGSGSSQYAGMARRLLQRGPAHALDHQHQHQQSDLKPWEAVGDFRVVRYTGLKASASYSEWRAWREWVDAQGGF